MLIVLIGGCAAPLNHETFDARFERHGRFALRINDGHQQEAVHGGFDWRAADSQHWQLSLRSPLGAVLARLSARAGRVTLERPGKPARHAPDAASLMMEMFGAHVPLDAAVNWLEGKVVEGPDVTVIQRDASGRIQTFEEDGWRVRFARYDDRGPRTLEMDGHDGARTVWVRMIVDNP